MRILLAHNKYQQLGGEDIAFEQESELLSEAGHAVRKFVVSNDAIKGLSAKLATFLNVLENRPVIDELGAQVSSFKPEIVHFHNFFPTLSPAAVAHVLEREIPVLQTLHNYRHVCANAMFLRDGTVCQLCLNKPARVPAIVHRCYRKSLLGSYAVVRVGRRIRQLYDAHPQHLTLIALTNFSREQMINDGYSPSRILIKPNSIPDAGLGPQARERRVVFVGRLSPEKGADFFVRLAKSIDAIFEVIGDGPERERLGAISSQNVVFHGRLEHHQVLERIKGAAVVAVPSRWFEGFPMIVLEAFATGTPVIASRIGSLAEIVEDGISGITPEVDDYLAWQQAIQLMLDEPERARLLGQGARLTFEKRYTSAHNIERLLDLYSRAIDRAAAARGNSVPT